jgi:hypothetical protein
LFASVYIHFDIDIKNLSKEEGSKLTENSLLYKGGIEMEEDIV